MAAVFRPFRCLRAHKRLAARQPESEVNNRSRAYREVKVMRRSAAKSRADKSRTDSVPVNAAPAVQPIETVDIVPGRLTESSWTSMISQEEGEEVVADIIAELMEGVMDRCYQLYLKRQLIPFSVWWAQNNLVETLECLLLRRDEGDDLEHGLFWQEDQEPQPCAIDSWAEGCVPVLHAAQE